MFLARKITLAKWKVNRELSEGEISADAVTADLRTRENKLSFWRCGSETEVEDAALAIAAASERVDKFYIVWIDEDEFKTDDQTLKNTPGWTHATELVKQHVDVCRLDYVRLGKVAHHVITAIKEERCILLNKRRVTDILVAAVEQERVNLNDLDKRVQEEVRKSLQAGQ